MCSFFSYLFDASQAFLQCALRASTNFILDETGTFQNDKELIKLIELHQDGYIQPKEERKLKKQRK